MLFVIAAILPVLTLPLSGNEGPWHMPVEGFVAPAPGEHPRLLFRRSDLPALRSKAKTPEGQAILKRLRTLLDGARGETMTTVFRPGKEVDEKWREEHLAKPGVYTFSHAAGYGLLYQLTGERKYAEYGRLCFEKALEGVPDRDGRYGFRTPGGPLRAGPSLGWYAVG
ncbi:MAG: hypothetical protein CL922_06690, partial [Deltaproteobacteria bacterium]|nr:hypothetical protein [Deltaproteobacteria bacterium]